jgi:hypothetical protein
MGLVVMARRKEQAKRLSERCSKMWVVAEVFLFVLVGASIKIDYFSKFFSSLFGLIGLFINRSEPRGEPLPHQNESQPQRAGVRHDLLFA